MIDFIEAQAKPLTSSQAVIAARMILDCYRHSDVNNPDAFHAALAGILASYPADIAQAVANPQTGIASKLKFLPSLAEVRDALQAEAQKRQRVLAAARWMLTEHERRQKEDAERAWFVDSDRRTREILETRLKTEPDRYITAYEARK